MRRSIVTGVLLAGFAGGYATKLALPQKSPEAPRSNPNVVVLRSEKRVTLRAKGLRLAELAEALAAQTKYRISLDKAYADSPAQYSFVVRDVPLKDVLAASGFMVGGAWERRTDGYHLRPMTPEERVARAGELEQQLFLIREVLMAVDPASPGLDPAQAAALKDLRQMPTGLAHLPTFDPNAAGNWSVWTRRGSAAVIYDPGRPGERSVSQSIGWTTSHEPVYTVGGRSGGDAK